MKGVLYIILTDTDTKTQRARLGKFARGERARSSSRPSRRDQPARRYIEAVPVLHLNRDRCERRVPCVAFCNERRKRLRLAVNHLRRRCARALVCNAHPVGLIRSDKNAQGFADHLPGNIVVVARRRIHERAMTFAQGLFIGAAAGIMVCSLIVLLARSHSAATPSIPHQERSKRP